MAKRKSAASKTVASAMRRRKSGTLRSGSGQKVRSRKQAIAIGLNEAREEGADVPKRPDGGRRKTSRKSSRSGSRSSSTSSSGSRSSSRSSGSRTRASASRSTSSRSRSSSRKTSGSRQR